MDTNLVVMRDQSFVANELAVAEWHLEEGARRIQAQFRIIEELRRRGRETRLALSVLVTLQAAQALCVADRDRLRRELAELSTA